MGTKTHKAIKLNVLAWNANGLFDKRAELIELSSRISPEVICVSETHLSPSQPDPRLPQYVMFRNDRITRGGGTAIYVKTNLDHSQIDLPLTPSIEATCVIVSTTALGTVRIIACYAKPGSKFNHQDLTSIVNMDNLPLIIIGDLNAKHISWNSRRTNPRGKQLHAFILNSPLNITGPNTPTHYHHGHTPDILDIAITRGINQHNNLTSLQELSSDHLPILLEVFDDQEPELEGFCTSINWENFTQHLQQNFGPLPTITTTEELNQAVHSLTNKTIESIQHATKTFPKTRRKHPLLPPHSLHLIEDRKRARRLWIRSKDPADKRSYNALTTQIRDAILTARNEAWQALLQEVDTDDSKLWRISKSLRKRPKGCYAIHGQNGLVYTSQEKAEAIAVCLEDQLSPSFQNIDIPFVESVEEYVNEKLLEEDTNPISFMTPENVANLIKAAKTKSAPGPDKIPNKALKNFPSKPLIALTNIINSILRLRHFPSNWKQANIIAIPKPGKDPKFPQNYRPISLLNSMAKIMESVILIQIKKHSTSHNIIPFDQFGFREGHSTVHQLSRVVEYILEGFNNRQHTGGVFLDVAKAFDKVWHDGLIYKLLKLNFPLQLTQLLASYLQNRFFKVRFQGAHSLPHQILSGVPQGSVIAPILFNIFVSDIPKPPPSGITAQYADDTTLLFRSRHPEIIKKRLQTHLDSIEEWCHLWRVTINPDKSSAILFSKRLPTLPDQLEMDLRPIPWRDKTTYLGLILDKRLNFHDQLANAIMKAKNTAGQLIALLGKHSSMSIRNKTRLYTSIIRPQLTYAAPAWIFAMSATNLRRLRAQQHKLLRLCTSSPWFVKNIKIQEQLQIPSLTAHISQLATNYFDKCAAHPNPEVSSPLHYDANHPWKFPRSKNIAALM